jgi:putative peptidoglycan lipid II flippase
MKKASTQYITKIASGIFKTSLLISVFFALDKVLGLIRQILLAKSIGISKIADAFYAANNIPDAITTLVAGGVTLAFIPVLAQSIAQEDTPQTWRLFNTIFNLSLLFMFVCSLMVWLGSDVLVSAPWGVAPGLDKPTQDTTSSLMRLNLIASIFFTASGLIMATLQAHKRFFLTLLAPLIYTLVQILAILFLVPTGGLHIANITLPTAGWGIYGLIYGVILSSVVHLSIQLPGLLKLGWRWQLVIDSKDEKFKTTLSLLGMRLVTMFFIQLIFLTRDNFASRLTTGTVSALNYGWFIMQFPETLIGTAIGTALLPTLAEIIARKDYDEFRILLKKNAKIIISLSIILTLATGIVAPFALKYISLIVHIRLDNPLLLSAILGFMVGLAGQSLMEIIARAYYALGDAKTYLIGTIFRCIIIVVITFILFNKLGILAIALADSIGTTLTAWVLYRQLMSQKLN